MKITVQHSLDARYIRLIFVGSLILVLMLTGCQSSPAATLVPSTSTPLPPTNTLVPPTDTLVPPTDTPEPPVKILFVGNSLSYWGFGLERTIESLAGSADPPLVIEADTVVMDGASLKIMWNTTKAREMIDEGAYDVVVLQGNMANFGVETFHEYTRIFVEKIRGTGAEPVMFMPWARKGVTTEEIAQAYGDIAAELGIDVAPVGIAWQRAMEERPELDLYDIDDTHQSIYGNYLAVTVIYATILGRSPIGLTWDSYGALTGEEVTFLQRIAWETVQEYQAQQ